MDHYYDVVDDMYIPGRWYLHDPITDEGCEPYEFTAGTPVHLLSKPTIEINRSGFPLDYTRTSFAVPVASPRLAEAFARIAGPDLQCIPVRVGSREGYNILVTTRLVRCIDEQRSEFMKWTEADGRPDLTGDYRMVTKLHVDTTLIPPDIHIFRILGWEVAVIVSNEMVEAAKAIGATGLKLTPVD